jgi:hypothetical protein
MNALILAIAIAAAAVLLVIFGTSIYCRYLGISRGRAALLLLVAVAGGIGTGLYFSEQLRRGQMPDWRVAFIVGLAGFLPAVLIPFLAKLYLKWLCGQLTEAERNSGMEGVRTWLRGGNLFCVLFLSLCAWQLFGYSFLGVMALTLMALLAYPVLNMASISSQPAQPMETKTNTENLKTERERVLKMLDDGKITAQESADLLSALSLSDKTAQEVKSPPSSPQRKMVMVGLVLLLIGFFLPWFSINPGKEMGRAMGDMQQGMNQMMPQNQDIHFQTPFELKTGYVNIGAGDIKYGLGWLVLLLGIAAAALPYLATNLSVQDRQKATLIGLGIGGIILVYLLTQNIRFVSVGILLAMAGYALQFMGTLKEKELRLG